MNRLNGPNPNRRVMRLERNSARVYAPQVRALQVSMPGLPETAQFTPSLIVWAQFAKTVNGG
jgi:hypothetical protein